jgi:hypothetical protein
MSKRVKAVVRIDDIDNLQAFDREHKGATWFYIVKGDRIAFAEDEVFLQSISKTVPVESGKTLVIGFTAEIAAVGLVDDKAFLQLLSMIAPKKFVEVSTFKLRY